MKPSRHTRWYDRLMRVFPSEFRADFGASMRADFDDETAEARRHGRRAVAGLWLRTVAGFLRTAPRERLSRLAVDARHGIRLGLRRPLSLALPALVLGIGIAALTATFAVVDAFMLRPLPFADAERLVHVWTREKAAGTQALRSAWPDVQAWAQARALSGIAAFNYTEEDLLAGDRPERVHAARVTANLLDVLGVAPAAGRGFAIGEDRAGAASVALVSDAFARARFGSPAAALGRSIRVGDATHEVVGVMRSDFVFPLPITEIWLPYAFDASYTRQRQSLQAVARLAGGIELQGAASELETIAAAQSRLHGDREPRGATLEPLRDALNFADDVFAIGGPVLMLTALLILLVACANVGSVLLGQSAARAREASLRMAVGASRARLVRQFLFEQLPLVTAALASGLAIAGGALRGVAAAVPPDLYRVGPLAIDRRAALFACGASALAVLAAAIMPALRVSRVDVSPVLRAGGPSQSAPRHASRAQHVLIGVQVCASVALVATTLASLQGLETLASRETGFDRQSVLTLKFILPASRYPTPAAIADFHRRVAETVRQAPRVAATATVNHLPLNHERARLTYLAAGVDAGARKPTATEVVSSPGYFASLRLPLHEGRDFGWTDGPGSPPVAVVNRALADRLGAGAPALGLRLELGENGAPVTIVGIVGNARHSGLDGADEPIIYRPAAQVPRRYARLVVRTDGDPLALAADVQQAVWSIDGALPLTEVRSLDDVVSEFLLPQKALSTAIGVLGTAAIVVASAGLYGLLALLVAGRRQEIGVRVALGAGTGAVIGAVAGRLAVVVAVGLIAGLGASTWLSRSLAALVPGISATDPRTLFLTPLLLVVGATLAAVVPLRRATRIDPLAVIRQG